MRSGKVRRQMEELVAYSVLGYRLAAIVPVRSNQLYASLPPQSVIKRVAVVGLIADQPRWQLISETGVQGGFDQSYFVGASAARADGDRKTVSVRKAHDFGAFAAFGLAHASAPFLAGAKVPSMNPSRRSSPPRFRRSSAKAARIFENTPDARHSWNRRWQVLLGGYRSGRSFQGAPVRSIQKIPFNTCRESRGGRPDAPGLAFGSGRCGATNSHCSFVRSMPSISTHQITSLRFWDAL